ncbi:CHAT domain-containing tetratricopeptide repeat protein [Burkholderia ubonensis]|uniref:CHAT domain-containing tetratricopeptide repeat protein n=1 Tax=Burkholderia ubonensis TaxID=101571 RepID=UPI000AA7A493|nr:CHAT domain-containing protein [Burkholderia ubonensis]
MNSPSDPFSQQEMQACIQSAENDLRAGNLKVAYDAYRTLLKRLLERRTYSQHAFRAADLVVIERLAELAVLFGHAKAADSLLRAMIELCDGAGNVLGADYARLKRVEMHLVTGQLPSAVKGFGEIAPRIGTLEEIDTSTQGLDAWEHHIRWNIFPAGEMPVLLTRAYLIMGDIAMKLGAYGDAQRLLERGVAHALDAPAESLARRTGASLRLSHAQALMEAGCIDAAQTALGQCVADPLSPAAALQMLELAGKIFLLRGRLAEAIARLREAMSLCEAKGLRRGEAVSALNLAHALILVNRVEEALRFIERAQAIAVHVGDDALSFRADAIRDVAIARRTSSAQAVAMTMSVTAMADEWSTLSFGGPGALPSTLRRTSDRDSYLAQFEDRALAFQWALAIDPGESREHLRMIEAAFQHTDSRIIAARLKVLAGMQNAASGEYENAESCFADAMSRLETLGFLPELWRLAQQRAENLQRLGKQDEATRLAADAATMLDSLCASLDGGDRAIFLLNKFTAEEKELKARVEQLVREMEATNVMGPLRKLHARYRILCTLQDLTDRLNQYKSGLADQQVGASGKRSARFAHRHAGRIPRLLSRMLMPARDRAIVTFIVLPDRILVTWSAFMTLGFAVRPVTRVALREKVREWHQFAQSEVAAPWTSNTSGDEDQRQAHGAALLHSLGDMLNLSDWISALPASVHRLTIIADDVLHGLPFAALMHDGQFLVERFAISLGFSAEHSKRGDDRLSAGMGLVVGVAEAPDEAPLEYVEDECKHVGDWLRKHGLAAVVTLNEEATPAAVKSALEQASLAHFACHGTFEPNRPDSSGLLLMDSAGASQTLTVRDLAALNLSKCRHVTLSSCWSADSYVIPGRWIVSLPEVLCRSGVGAVMASLWQVADQVSKPLMTRFYENLEHMPRDIALREVQLNCMRNSLTAVHATEFAVCSPFFWAGFVLYGSPARIRLRKWRAACIGTVRRRAENSSVH